MKAMFAHDNKFCLGEDGQYYSDGQFPYQLWQRYLEVFDEIVVAGRIRPLRTGEKLETLDLSSGHRVRFIEIPSISNPGALLFSRGSTKQKLTEAMDDCDALIVRVSEIGRMAYHIAKKQRKPWVVEVVNTAFEAFWNYGTWQGKVYAPLAEYLTRNMIANSPYALYVTQEYLQKRYPCKGKTLGCSDVQVIMSGEAVRKKRSDRLHKRPNPFQIGLIGSLVNRHKGLDVAFKALHWIKKIGFTFEFRILGGGDPVSWRKMAAEYGLAKETYFCGTIPSGEPVGVWLDGIDLYLQPSYIEGLPRALVEAMNRGCPALASNVGGIPELLGKECLHTAGDARSLAQKIELAMVDVKWREFHSEINFNRAREYDSDYLNGIRQKFWRNFVTEYGRPL